MDTEQSDILTTCDICGTSINTDTDDYSTNLPDVDVVCYDCYDAHYTTCYDCGDIIRLDDAEYGYGYAYCPSCYSERFTECDCCGRAIYRDDAHYSYADDEYHCNRCATRTIRPYHDTDKDARYFGTAAWFTGAEFEVENRHGVISNDDAAAMVREHFESGLCFFEHDGSLEDGFEWITAPMSLDYLRDIEPNIRRACADLRANGFRAHNTTTCGLHFHASWSILGDDCDARDNATARLLLLSERFEDTLVALSRRTTFGYCQPDKGADTLDAAKEKARREKSYGERYRPWNLTNYNTIEYRLTRGTLNADTALASWYLALAMLRASALMTDDDATECATYGEWLAFSDLVLPTCATNYLTDHATTDDERM